MSARLIAAQADLNFLHSDSVRLTDPMTALQAYCAMTSDVPGWLARAFRIRDFISRRFNVADIHGFTRGDQCMCQPSVSAWTSSLSRPSATSSWC